MQWGKIIFVVLLIMPMVMADAPDLPITSTEQIMQKIQGIENKIDAIINKQSAFEEYLVEDLNTMRNFTETRIANSENNIKSELQHKTDFPTLVVSLIMISILNWVLFGMLKSKGAI